MQDFQRLIGLLAENEVRFVIIGGFAASLYGSSCVTEDIDLCIPFDAENMQSLLNAFRDIHPAHRLIGKSRPLDEGADQLSRFKNLYLQTDLGSIDLLSEVAGVGRFNDVMEHSVEIELYGMPCCVLDIESLIRTKREMARPKDQEAIRQLEAIKEISNRTEH